MKLELNADLEALCKTKVSRVPIQSVVGNSDLCSEQVGRGVLATIASLM